jgi:membrane associated rhomboid family serine protease/Zn-finger nucleic acid-binding protein
MNCPKCNAKLEIFARDGKEIYVCPLCLSALLPDEPSVKILKYFCNQEIINLLISNLIDDSLFDNMKQMLSAEKNLTCPKCKSNMQLYDFNRKIRFSVNRCRTCGAIWVNPMQAPLLSIAFLENNPDDLSFKQNIENLYKILAKKHARRIVSLDEVIAPFVVATGLAPAIPVGDNVITKTKPLATWSLIIACTIIFIVQMSAIPILSSFSLIADRILHRGEFYRLITYTFLHGGLFHLLFNMIFLRFFGRSVEDELGREKYLYLFSFGAIVSGIFFILTTTQKDIPCVGASGAISAIIGAYLILFPKAKIRFNVLHPFTFQKLATTKISSLYYILSWIIMNIFFALVQKAGNTIGVAYMGHIGGFIAGIVFVEVSKNLKRG